MLELHHISLRVGREANEHLLLHEVSARFPQGHFAAIVGQSGCGKTTLVNAIAGLLEPTSGAVMWEGRDLALEEDLAPHEIGYVPQFSIAYDFLTVRESVETASRLRVGGIDEEARAQSIDKILHDVGLEEIADRRVRVLSGGQKRRLALAQEMVSSPALLICDEVTSGLDPKAEDEIVRLMKKISLDQKRIVIFVTHSLRHLALYDSVVVLHEGHMAFHARGEFLAHYFDVKSADDLFPRLAQRSGADWHTSWSKHREAFENDEPPVPKSELDMEQRQLDFVLPSAVSQCGVLFARRLRIFFRDRTQLILQLALLIGFPLMVVIFAWDGLPQIKNMSMSPQGNILEQIMEKTEFLLQSSRVGRLVSGLAMFQVILLTLMGSSNAAREIAAERLIFEKEKFAGVRPSSYVASKACFLSLLVLVQSVWMGIFVNTICRFPGSLLTQIVLLIAVNGAMAAVCLGISSLMKSPEQASLVSVYLVGFQLPLSGAVLALPRVLSWITRPFIAAYWSWSGFLQTLVETRFYDAVRSVSETDLSPIPLCLWVLCSHVALGLFIAYAGCKHSRWH
jgi:ABC-type multidrug transport system ATPase subunit